MYASYAIQAHDPSGDVFVLEYNDVNTVTGINGPWHYRELETLLAIVPGALEILEYDPDVPHDWQWQCPTYVYDPVND